MNICRQHRFTANKSVRMLAALAVLAVLSVASAVFADEPGPREPYHPRVTRQPRPEPEQPAPPPREQPLAPVAIHEESSNCLWNFRLAAGVPIWFFDKESDLPGAGLYGDFFSNEYRVNFRIGIEGRHMFLSQDAAAFAAEFPGKTTRVTYLRIPMSVEYILPLDGDQTQLFLGGGPDIIHTANDLEDTNVGLHLGGRLLYNFDPQWGVAVDAGYMWGDVDGPGEDVSLDGAYITPTLNYTF